MARYLRVPLIGTIILDKELNDILEPHRKKRKQSEFVRQAILDKALGMGFSGDDNNDYCVPNNVLSEIAKWLPKRRYVDYDSIIAFYWLLFQPKYRFYNKSDLLIEVITKRG